MSTTQIKNGFNGGSDDQLKVNPDGSIDVDVTGSSISADVNITEVGGNPVTSTLPVSGTVTANQGTPNTLSNGWPVEITDGSNVLGTSANPLYVTLNGVVMSVTATSPLASSGGLNPNITIQQATSLQNGYLSDADWITFNDKVSIVGTIDSQSPSSNGLVINLQDIYAQSASTSFPGLVNTSTQSFAGNKTFTGTVDMTAFSTLALVVGSDTLVVDTVNGAVGINTLPATTTVLDAINNSGATKAVQLTGYGSNVGVRGRRANGTLSSPTQSLSGDILSFYSGRGYGATGFGASSTGVVNIAAAENFTDTSMATNVNVSTTPTGSVTSRQVASFGSTGAVTLGPTSSTAINQFNGGLNQTTNTISAATYTVDSVTTDYVIFTNSTSNAITITLPAPTNGRILFIQDSSGTASTNNITVKQHASETLNGLTQYVLARNYIGIQLISNGTNWSVIKVSDSGSLFITGGTTYTTPTNITPQTRFKFTLIGGGGGSAGVTTSNGRGTGGGGGGGGILYISGLSPATAYSIAIGAGGAAGASSGTVGGGGGNTTLTIGATTYTAAGGGGGQNGVSTVGGLPGGATNCTINIAGEWGGWNVAAGANTVGGKGGDSPFGFGIGGPGMGPNTFFGTSIAGSGYGGGGGGAANIGSPVAGAAGSQGCILVEWMN